MNIFTQTQMRSASAQAEAYSSEQIRRVLNKHATSLLLLAMAFFGFHLAVNAQCTATVQYPSTAVTPTSSWTTLNSCNYAGEFARVNVTSGSIYEFSTCSADGATVTYDTQLTLRNNSGVQLAYSDDACGAQSKVTWTATYSGIAQIHLHQFNCQSNTTCTGIRMRLTAGGGGGGSSCNFTTAYGSVAAPAAGATVAFPSCSYAGEYNTMTGAAASTVYTVLSSIGTDYVTVRQGSAGGTVIGSGTVPFTFTSTVSGSYFFHIASNSSCGTQNSCRNTSVSRAAGPSCAANPGCAADIGSAAYASVIAADPFCCNNSWDSTCNNAYIAAGGLPSNAPECQDTACDLATPIACNSSVTGSTVGALTHPVAPFCGTAVGTGGTAWYTFVGTGQQTTISTCSALTSYDTKLWVYSGSCGALVCEAGNDDSACAFSSVQSTINFVPANGVTYYIAIGGFLSAQGSYELSVTCGTPGCTDPAAANYNPSATIDNGSCIYCDGTLVTLDMFDSFGDGWNGATYNFINGEGVNVANGTMSGSFAQNIICLEDGCYTFTVGGGTFDGEISWTLNNIAGGSLSGGAPSSQVVEVGTGCVQGCTDALACNYDAMANFENGSCYYACNDTPALAFNLSVNALGNCSGLSNQNIDDAFSRAAEAVYGSLGDGKDLWYSFTAATSGARIEVATADFDALIELQDASNNAIELEDTQFVNGSEILNIGSLTAGETYYIRVYSWLNTNGPANFDICVQSIPETRCDYGPGPYSLCNTFKAKWVTGAADFIFNFTSQTTGITYTYQQGFAGTFVQLFNVPGLAWGDDYDVAISVVFNLTNGSGATEAVAIETSNVCDMFVIDQPLAQLRPQDNQANFGPHFLGNFVAATPWICSTIDWTWEFVNTDGSQLPITHQRGASNRFLRLSDVPGLAPGAVYQVRVKPEFANGSATSYGAAQLLAIIGAAGMAGEIESPVAIQVEADRAEEITAPALSLYPNPTSGEFVNLIVHNLSSDLDRVNIEIYDLFGKLVMAEQHAIGGSTTLQLLLSTADYASGVYIVNVIINNTVQTERLVIQK
jgi:hypothetical protein